MAKKIILDTDIGSDIDDAVCLAYLLAQPECELVGITTVSGEAVKRAQMISAMCKIAGKEIPIYPGVDKPLLIESLQPRAQQAKVLEKWEHQTEFPEHQAIEFLRKTIRANPGEITLLAIGPMTNVALLFSIDPEIPALLKELVLMCGVFTEEAGGKKMPEREWNAFNDPHASAIVYNAAPQVHRSIGLDVTTQVVMEAAQFKEKCQQITLLQPVLDFAEVWFEHAGHVTFHDPLAATVLFDEEICRFAKGRVSVELVNKELEGKTYWEENGAEGRHEVALEVDKERFFKHYFGVFGS